jgi:hypothetical protein
VCSAYWLYFGRAAHRTCIIPPSKGFFRPPISAQSVLSTTSCPCRHMHLSLSGMRAEQTEGSSGTGLLIQNIRRVGPRPLHKHLFHGVTPPLYCSSLHNFWLRGYACSRGEGVMSGACRRADKQTNVGERGETWILFQTRHLAHAWTRGISFFF